MTWQEYEDKVIEYFKSKHPGAVITKNEALRGYKSNTERDIDILIESQIFGHSIQIAVECKNWNSKLDVADVGSFIDKLNDVGIKKGVMISKRGYSEAAHARAKSEIELQLQVLDFDNMPEYYGFWGNPYKGPYGALISAPNGWVVDNRVSKQLKGAMLCHIHPMEFSLEESYQKRKIMFFNLEPIIKLQYNGGPQYNLSFNLQELLLQQDNNVLLKDSKATISYWTESAKKHNILYRKIIYDQLAYTEFTGAIELDDFLIYCVCPVPHEYLPDDFARLRYVMNELHLLPKLVGVDPTNSHWAWQILLNVASEE